MLNSEQLCKFYESWMKERMNQPTNQQTHMMTIAPGASNHQFFKQLWGKITVMGN